MIAHVSVAINPPLSTDFSRSLCCCLKHECSLSSRPEDKRSGTMLSERQWLAALNRANGVSALTPSVATAGLDGFHPIPCFHYRLGTRTATKEAAHERC